MVTATLTPPPAHCEPLAYRMPDASRVTGISIAKLYELIAAGELKSVKRGGRRLILRADLETFLRADA
jgi:excisionase family DNA binding protein